MRIIKKYPNRRLYDTEISRYITLSEIKELVIKHIPFKVIDVRSEEDMTNNVLLQIISEQEGEQTPIFTAEILQNIIRFYGHPMQKMMSDFLEKSLISFTERQTEMQKYLQKMFGSEAFFTTMTDLANKNLTMWQASYEQFFKQTSASETDKKEEK